MTAISRWLERYTRKVAILSYLPAAKRIRSITGDINVGRVSSKVLGVKVGDKFGRLKVMVEVDRDKNKNICWLCKCECGNTTVVRSSRLIHHATRSCGCLRSELATESHTTHGLSKQPTWCSWQGAKGRCRNENNKDYHNYGGRGVQFCERWNDFNNFYEDMGERPDGMQLDRKNVNGNYEPSNCRWATPEEQANNRRNSKLYTYHEKTQPLSGWAKDYNININTLENRVYKLRMSFEAALLLPVTDRRFKTGANHVV
jgi:hypothetical protein